MDRCQLKWKPDLVNANDWQTGLIAPLLEGTPARPATVFTIHNLAYQGLFDLQAFENLMLPEQLWSIDGLEFYGQFSFIKGGILFSDRVTTVSPTYADEVRTPTYGCGLDGLLNNRRGHFSGVLNGIDYQTWNPKTDPHIAVNYSTETYALKKQNKVALQKEFGLAESEQAQLFGYIGRLVDQKGVDLILQILPGILDSGGQMIFLGAGNKEIERSLLKLNDKHANRIGVHIGYDEPLSHRIEAGCDTLIMPSRFEPCGLNQIYSLRYGTIPVVRNTGGLADTVHDANPQNLSDWTATGFIFEQPDADSLWQAVERAINYYKLPAMAWKSLAITGMQQDFSWEASAERYLQIYQSAIDDLE
jgi:starch synthase